MHGTPTAPDAPGTPGARPARPRRRRRGATYAGLVAGALAALALAVAIVAWAGAMLFGLLADWLTWEEWHCSQGEAPILRVEGPGSTCHRLGEPLPEGWRWDPKGNRPISE